MKVRLQLRRASQGSAQLENQRKIAHTAAVLMTPAALAAYALGLWRIAADLNWTGEFAITRGIFSHWQVWIAVGILIQATGVTLARYARGGHLNDHDAPAS
jgi:hypothetical protein